MPLGIWLIFGQEELFRCGPCSASDALGFHCLGDVLDRVAVPTVVVLPDALNVDDERPGQTLPLGAELLAGPEWAAYQKVVMGESGLVKLEHSEILGFGSSLVHAVEQFGDQTAGSVVDLAGRFFGLWPAGEG